MSDLTVAKTILDQLGGRKFLAMTGAKNLIGGPSSLSFSLPGNPGFVANGINRVRITHNAEDLYDIEFGKVRGSKYTVILTVPADCDSLRPVFTRITGLQTRM